MEAKSTSCSLTSLLPSLEAGWWWGSHLQGPPSASSRPLAQLPHPRPKSGVLARAPNPDSSSSSSRFPACLPPILWPSQSLLPKITQRLGVLCPERCSCLAWGRDRAQETLGGGGGGVGGGLGVLASWLKTGSGWGLSGAEAAWRESVVEWSPL